MLRCFSGGFVDAVVGVEIRDSIWTVSCLERDWVYVCSALVNANLITSIFNYECPSGRWLTCKMLSHQGNDRM